MTDQTNAAAPPARNRSLAEQLRETTQRAARDKPPVVAQAEPKAGKPAPARRRAKKPPSVKLGTKVTGAADDALHRLKGDLHRHGFRNAPISSVVSAALLTSADLFKGDGADAFLEHYRAVLDSDGRRTS